MKYLIIAAMLFAITIPSISSAADPGQMTEGQVRKVNMDSKKITIRHGPIKNLNMPGMTMVFQVNDPAMLNQVKAGDKVRFTAEDSGGAITLTHIETTK